MSEPLQFVFDVSGENFTSAGEASVTVKKNLRMLGFPPDVLGRVATALDDSGPGIADIELAMREGFSTAPENIRNLGFGAGMGLPNMKRNTDSMKIESELGKGTKITMTVNT